jgi:hypothetical protein
VWSGVNIPDELAGVFDSLIAELMEDGPNDFVAK